MRYSFPVFLVCLCYLLCSFKGVQWWPVENKPGNFKIDFPTMPQKSEKDAQTPAGSIKMNIFSCNGDMAAVGNKMYMMMYSDYPEKVISSSNRKSLVDTFFKNSIDGAVAAIHGKLISIEKSDLSKYPGRFVHVSFGEGKGMMDIHFYMVKSRLYMLEVGYLKGEQNSTSEQHFFKSFGLLQNK